MSLNPLSLKSLALRRVIQERGVEGDHIDLTPSMRQELVQVSSLLGTWELVDQHLEVGREDGGAVSSGDEESLRATMHDLTSGLAIGGKISVSCRAGPVWVVAVQGKEHLEISLMRAKKLFPNNIRPALLKVSFDEQVHEEGKLLHAVWVKVVR